MPDFGLADALDQRICFLEQVTRLVELQKSHLFVLVMLQNVTRIRAVFTQSPNRPPIGTYHPSGLVGLVPFFNNKVNNFIYYPIRFTKDPIHYLGLLPRKDSTG